MQLVTVAAALLPLAHGYSKEQYESGAVMAKMMVAKEVIQLHILIIGLY